jgi:tetratricopeptide (TPR) repeat protein
MVRTPVILAGFIFLSVFNTAAQDGRTAETALSIPGQPAELQIAYGYFKQAEVLFNMDRPELAAGLLDVSLEFRPDFSESCFLYARILMREQDTTYRAVQYLEQALSSGTWTETDPLTASRELVRLYVRTKRFRDAEALMNGLEGGAAQIALGGRGSADLSELWARTLIGLGERQRAEVFLEQALQRFPGSGELYSLFSQVLTGAGKPGKAIEVLRRGRRELSSLPELVYESAALETDSKRRLELLDRYFQMGGSDPGAALLAAFDADGEPGPYVEQFFSLGGNHRVGYLDALGEALVQDKQAAGREDAATGGRQPEALAEARAHFLEQVRSFSGQRIVDSNGDGFYEQRFEYGSGTLQSWVLDGNQDGLPEARVRFEAGIPVLLTLSPLGGRPGDSTRERPPEIEYRYSNYPYLETVNFSTERSRREYRLLPYQWSQPAFLSPSFEAVEGPYQSLRLQFREGLVRDERVVRENSYQMAEYPMDSSAGRQGGAPRLYHLLRGRITRMDEDPDADGRFTHTVLYLGSLPVEGRRDLDGDGVAEIREEYKNGTLWKIALDEDGDGMEEFVQVFEEGMTRMFWDYDDDGRFDSRQSSTDGGGSLREFSSNLDGSYDLRVKGEPR